MMPGGTEVVEFRAVPAESWMTSPFWLGAFLSDLYDRLPITLP